MVKQNHNMVGHLVFPIFFFRRTECPAYPIFEFDSMYDCYFKAWNMYNFYDKATVFLVLKASWTCYVTNLKRLGTKN